MREGAPGCEPQAAGPWMRDPGCGPQAAGMRERAPGCEPQAVSSRPSLRAPVCGPQAVDMRERTPVYELLVASARLRVPWPVACDATVAVHVLCSWPGAVHRQPMAPHQAGARWPCHAARLAMQPDPGAKSTLRPRHAPRTTRWGLGGCASLSPGRWPPLPLSSSPRRALTSAAPRQGPRDCMRSVKGGALAPDPARRAGGQGARSRREEHAPAQARPKDNSLGPGRLCQPQSGPMATPTSLM